MHERNRKREAGLYICSFVALYGGILVTKGPFLGNDSGSYTSTLGFLPPLYPTFLLILRIIFGDNIYLSAAVVIQTILAVYSTLLLYKCVLKTFPAIEKWKWMIWLILILSWYKMDNPLNLRMSCNLWILTEGIALSLFYIFCCCSIWFMKEPTCNKYIKLLISVVLLALTRAQFVCCFIMVFVYAVVLLLSKKANIYRFILLVIGLVVSFAVMRGGESIYRIYATSYEEQSLVYQTVGKHLMYYSSDEDAEQIADEAERQLFWNIQQEMINQGYGYKVENGIFDEALNYKYYFEYFREYKGLINNYIATNYSDGDVEEISSGKIKAEIIQRQMLVLDKYYLRWVWNSLGQIIPSMINCVAMYYYGLRYLLMVYMFIVIGVFLILNIYVIKKDKFGPENIFCLLILLYMIGNALFIDLAVAYMIRYVSYPFCMFYFGLLIILKKAMECFRQKRVTDRQE